MWALDNRTPFEAERTWVRDRDGAHHWIVVVKATYEIGSGGTLSLSENPVRPLFLPEYNGPDGRSGLRYEADMVAMKPATDVYLNAIAFATRRRPSTEVLVSLRIADQHKALVVYGDRVWLESLAGGIAPSAPEPFEVMPITYERAFGGVDQEDPDPRKHRIDFRNPVGTGLAAKSGHVVGRPAPNIEHPARRLGSGWPAGFGAIASYWSPRKDLAGTYDEKWMAQRKPLLPADYDPKCLLCSPLDQQVSGYLKGGELVELTNLTPDGRLRFTLPKLAQTFDTYFGSTCKEHTSELVSVIIESEGPRLILVWQTSLRCGNDGDYLDCTVIHHRERI